MEEEFLSNERLSKFDSMIKNTVKKQNKDYMRVISGYEGEGKSLFTAAEALRFNPDFDVAKQAVYSLEQFLDFQDTFDGQPGKVCFMDEAVLQLLGDDFNTKESKLFKKLFVTHRNKGHFYLLCTPTPWLMMPYIRQWRVRDFVLIYTDSLTHSFQRKFAYYTRKDYASFIISRKAHDAIMVPSEFVKVYKPSLVDDFVMITDEKVLNLYKEMDQKKAMTQKDLRKEARDMLNGDKQMTEERYNIVISDKRERAVKDVRFPIATCLVNEEGYTAKRACEITNMSIESYTKLNREMVCIVR